MLSNAYLHYALDLWFHRVVKPRCRGEAFLLRYADDFVCGFEHRDEAEQFYSMLKDRLQKFELELSEAKTRVIEFSLRAVNSKSFEFLGFEFRWGKDRSGKPHVRCRTARKKLRSAIERMTEWCKEMRSVKLSEHLRRLNAKLRGHYQYYGIVGNADSLQEFYRAVIRIEQK